MMNCMRLRAQTGFTLIEVLLVVVVLGVIAVIAIPSFNSSKDSNRVKNMQTRVDRGINAVESWAKQGRNMQRFNGNVVLKNNTQGIGEPQNCNTALISCPFPTSRETVLWYVDHAGKRAGFTMCDRINNGRYACLSANVRPFGFSAGDQTPHIQRVIYLCPTNTFLSCGVPIFTSLNGSWPEKSPV